jgi:GNAT superfamily N-acetyltransferase
VESVRPAAADERARCTELLGLARAEGARLRGADLFESLGTGGNGAAGATDEDLVADWSGGGPDRVLLVGLFEGAVVGLGAGRVVTNGADRCGQVACCYVEPGARQVGVGAALVAGLLEWFSSRGCTGVDALALPGDRATKQLYETAGLKARLLVLHRPLA